MSHDPSTPTLSTAAMTHGLRHDMTLHRHHQLPPGRRRSSLLPPVQAAAAATAPPPRARVVPAPAAYDASVSSWQPSSSSDYDQPRKVITIVDGTGVPRPRPNVKFLLNLQSSQTYEQFVRDVAHALDKGTASTVSTTQQPSVRLFTVRGREVAEISDLFRDDDVFIGIGVGRKELSVSEVRQIFEELYPNSEYSEILVRKWMRTRRRNGRPRHADTTKHVADSEVVRNLDETSTTAADDEERDQTVQEVENAGEVEKERLELKPADSRLDDLETLQNSERRLVDSEPRLSQSLARQRLTRVEQRRRGGSEPRRGKPLLPPLATTSSHQVHDREVDKADVLQRSRPRQRGRRLVKLPPLQDAPAIDAEPASKPTRKLQRDDAMVTGRAADASPVKETTARHDGQKDTHRSPAPGDHSSRRKSKERSKPAKQTEDSSAVKTDENYNIITEVPQLENDVQSTSARGKGTARSEANGKSADDTETSTSKISSRSGKERRHSRSNDVKMKTKFERQVSTVEHVTSSYEEGRVLGDGNFAVVKQCRHRESGREYAMKVIDKSKMAKKEDMLENEIAIMKQCNHVNIVRLYEEYETKNEIYLIMELVRVCNDL